MLMVSLLHQHPIYRTRNFAVHRVYIAYKLTVVALLGIIADIRTKVFLGGAVGQIPAVDTVLTKNPLYLMVADTHPVVKFTVERMMERQNSKKKAVSSVTGTPSTNQQSTKDFLTRCYEAQEKYPDLVTDRIIRMYNIDNVLAGSDTTSISLRAVCEIRDPVVAMSR